MHSFRPPAQQQEQKKFTAPQSWVPKCALGNNVVMSSVPGIGSIMAEEYTLQRDPHCCSKWTNKVQMIVVSVFTAFRSQICIAIIAPLHNHYSIYNHSHKQRYLGS